jgi:putative oxidoreductase
MTTTTNLDGLLAVAGRLLMASVFLPAGYGKITAAGATAGYLVAGGLPQSPALAVAVGLFELAAGVMLVVGYKARWAALALALFTLVASLLFHNFWSAPTGQQLTQQLLFSKNIGLVGGLMFLAALGAGPWSMDTARYSVGRPQVA